MGSDEPRRHRTRWARLEQSRPGVLGAPQAGPFDRILVSAMAEELPVDLVEQLVPGGVLVAPIQGQLWRVQRPSSAADDLQIDKVGRYLFVPLILE